MATVGIALTAPEAGWKRYDDMYPALVYTGSWTRDKARPSGVYASTESSTIAIGASIKFNFIGTKIRLTGNSYTNRTSNALIKIDGVGYIFTENYADTFQMLVFEKTGLLDGLHTVEIVAQDTNMLIIDAIDIDSTGRLLHPDEVTDIKDLVIGKRIRAHYQSSTSGAVGAFSGLGLETSDFIPVASSATPNGDFYYIYVDTDYLGRKKLIADRNIQHSISWDTLNTNGISSGSGLLMNPGNIVPIMTSDTAPSGIASASTINAAYYAWKAFNGIATGGNVWESTNLSPTAWLAYEFPTAKNIVSYGIVASQWTNEAPKDWTFEGSNDGNNWVILDTRTGETGWVNSINSKRVYNFNNKNSYTKYRLNMSASQGGFYYSIAMLELMEHLYPANQDSYSFTTCLLTGGTASGDKDNEWDQYIVGSSLNGTITPGDKNVWGFASVYSMTSTVNTSGAAYRTTRGYTASTDINYYVTSQLAATIGFRPVLLIESVFSLLNKSFLYFGGSYQKWNGTAWQSISTDLPTPAVFQSDGMDITTLLQASFDLVPSDFDLVTWTNVLDKVESAYVTATPKGQLILGEYDFSSLMDLTITATKTSDANLRFIASGDGGGTWKTYSAGAWNPITSDANTVATSGMTLATLNGLTQTDFDAIGNTIRIGYFIANDTIVDSLAYQKKPIATETPTLNSVKITFDELTIEGRMQDLEQLNAVNMAKLQFKSNSLLQSDKYELHDMVVDTFESSTTVDTSNALYDTTKKEFGYDTSVSAPAVQEIILPEEEMPTYRKNFMLNVDHAGNIDYEYSLDGGLTWMAITPYTIIDLTGKTGTALKVKAKLQDSTAKLRGIAFSWA